MSAYERALSGYTIRRDPNPIDFLDRWKVQHFSGQYIYGSHTFLWAARRHVRRLARIEAAEVVVRVAPEGPQSKIPSRDLRTVEQ